MLHMFVCVGERASGSLASFHANLRSRVRLISVRDRPLSELESKHYEAAVTGQVSLFFIFFILV